MEQTFLPLQVAYLTVGFVVLGVWFLIVLFKNIQYRAKLGQKEVLPIPLKIALLVCAVLVLIVLISSYYQLWTALFKPFTYVGDYPIGRITDPANLILLYLGFLYGALIPSLVVYNYAAARINAGLLDNLTKADLEKQKSSVFKNKLILAQLSMITGTSLILVIIGSQYFLASAFWTGLVTVSVLIIIFGFLRRIHLRKTKI